MPPSTEGDRERHREESKIASPHFDPTELSVLVSEFSHGVRAEVTNRMIGASK